MLLNEFSAEHSIIKDQEAHKAPLFLVFFEVFVKMLYIKILTKVFGCTKNPVIRRVILYWRNVIKLIVVVNLKFRFTNSC